MMMCSVLSEFKNLTLLLAAGITWFSGNIASGQVIVADDFNVPGAGGGFLLNSGVNSGINPPSTRLTGLVAPNLRYIPTSTKSASAFSITANKLRVTAAPNAGRFVLSENGATSFDFAQALGSTNATPQNPVVYDLKIRMANSSPGIHRCSFALGTAEGDATTWDFGIQLYRSSITDTFYTIGKRVDSLSFGLGTDLNRFITNTVPGTYGSEMEFLMRVTDAGAEPASFKSRVQLSMDGGITWFYDTASDPDLPYGWRLDGPGRHIMWDIAPDAGPVTYDNLSVARVPISATLVSPLENTSNIGASSKLGIAVSNIYPGNLDVVFYGREAPKPYPGPDFCIAVLPDTQNYAREAPDAAVKEMWIAQTEWIVTNRVSHNIVYVAHLGDIVQSGDIKNGSPNLAEWRNATNAMYRLENPTRTLRDFGIPYGLAVGNHDQEPIDDPDGTTTFFNQYFGVAHFQGRPYYGGNFGSNNDSHFDLFSSGGLDFIVLYFENERYGSAIMNWANAVLSTNQHRRAIAVAHYMGGTATPLNFSAQGSAIYNGLKANPNLFLMLGGHITGEGSRQDTYNGNIVRTFVSDYQGRANGGSGWMRLMYFSPTNNVVTIQTFSPWLNRYETDDNSEMFFSYNMQLPTGPGSLGTPYVPLGTNSAVQPASETSWTWTGLQSNKPYEWYARITDENGNSTTSSRWRFTTSANAAPIASSLDLTIPGDRPTDLTLPATDSNGDALTFRINSPTRGLVSNFDTNSGALTYTPAHGFRGLDIFSFLANDGAANSSIAAVRLNVTAPADTNANNLPDAWEAAYGISDPEADDDGDGQNNWAEYMANTNPTNAASVFKLISTTPDSNDQFTLTWVSVGGTRYRIQRSESDSAGGITGAFVDRVRFIHEEMDPAPYGTASTQSYTDTSVEMDVPTNATRFYRVQVIP